MMYQILLILCGLLLPTVGGTDAKNYFINPSSGSKGINQVWSIGEQQLISWRTTLPVYNVTIWQQSLLQQSAASQGNIYSKIHESDAVTNFTWSVQLYGFDLSYSNVFFMWINPDGPDGFVSAFFNITEPSSTSSPASTATPTATNANSSSVPSATPTYSDSSQASESSSEDSPSDLTTTGKIALGVGIGVGVPVLGALSALIWLLARRPNNSQQQMVQAHGYPPGFVTRPMPRRRNSQPKELQGANLADFYTELPEQQHQSANTPT